MAQSRYLAGLDPDQRTKLEQKLLARQTGRCFICDEPIDLMLHKGQLDIDHIDPLIQEGLDAENNFALTHASCNRSKGASNLEVARRLAEFERLQEEAKSHGRRGANLGDVLLSIRKTINNQTYLFSPADDRIVPIAVERIWLDFEFRHLLIRHFDSTGVMPSVQRGANTQAAFRRGVTYEIHNHPQRLQRLATPVLGDVTEHLVFDLVPLAGAGRKVADANAQPGLVRELL